MIAKVKIAPRENWCAHARESGERVAACVGMEAKIITNSMHRDERICDGRRWDLTESSGRLLREMAGAEPSQRPQTVCEHMLEMD